MLYYYCTNTTFLSIVKNKSIWLSDMTQSNDRYEINKFIDIVRESLQQELDSIPETPADYIPQKGPKRREYQKNENRRAVFASAIKRLKTVREDYYCLAICFSDVGDSLSQWRGYGDDGIGISIGFDEDLIRRLSEQHILFKFGEVKYYSGENDALIQNKMKKYINQLECISLDVGNSLDQRNTAIKNWCTKILDDDVPFYKPEGFIEERETRFCFVRYIRPGEISHPKENSHLKAVDFHVSNRAIIPHYELDLKDGDTFLSDIIREVTIGPCNDSDYNTVKSFLAKYGFNHKIIKVKRSCIPYRARE